MAFLHVTPISTPEEQEDILYYLFSEIFSLCCYFFYKHEPAMKRPTSSSCLAQGHICNAQEMNWHLSSPQSVKIGLTELLPPFYRDKTMLWLQKHGFVKTSEHRLPPKHVFLGRIWSFPNPTQVSQHNSELKKCKVSPCLWFSESYIAKLQVKVASQLKTLGQPVIQYMYM